MRLEILNAQPHHIALHALGVRPHSSDATVWPLFRTDLAERDARWPAATSKVEEEVV
jgi:hypothetical protein